MTQKLIICRGLPGSGKDFYAKQQLKANPNLKRVNMDCFRTMYDNYDYDRVDGRLVAKLRDLAIEEAFKAGYNVISSDTNLRAATEKDLRKIARKYNAEVEVIFFDTDLDLCITRDAERTGHDHVGEEVIRSFHERYLANRKHFRVENPLSEEELVDPEVYSPDPSLPRAILADLDGTLAKMDRSPYDWKACINDTLVEPVAEVVKHFAWNHQFDTEGAEIIIMSGRDSVCRSETEEWLRKHDVEYDHLFMRAQDDTRKDTTVKKELFDNHIRGKYQVLFVLDDRSSVVQQWRQLGLTCFQVAPGEF